jgi:hypothetical protein
VPYHVIIPPAVSRMIGALGLPRALWLQVLTRVRHELEHNADQFRGVRIDGHEDRLFRFRLTVADATYWHDFAFAVDDATAPGRLFVSEMRYRSRPIPP